MLQDIAPHHLFNQMQFVEPEAHDAVLCYRDSSASHRHEAVLVRRDGAGFRFPTYEELGWCGKVVFALSVDETRFFLLLDAAPETAPDGFFYLRVYSARVELAKPWNMAMATGYHLHLWYRDNRFCGRCGVPLVHSTWERALECPSCGNTVYPKIAPAIIVAVTWGDRILLARYAKSVSQSRALVAGFVEIGETAEETVAREVYEECGVRVKDIRYYKSQPWGIASDLLLGYTAHLDGDPTITLQEDELGYAEWVRREDISEEPDEVSLTRELICAFKDGRIQ